MEMRCGDERNMHMPAHLFLKGSKGKIFVVFFLSEKYLLYELLFVHLHKKHRYFDTRNY